MKFIERAEIVKRSKKPKSRKVYFYMEKDILAMWIQLIKDSIKTLEQYEVKK
ncbi:MAG: hypothetical protein ACXQS5_05620 [Candidatus Methanospirareceae archaeon]